MIGRCHLQCFVFDILQRTSKYVFPSCWNILILHQDILFSFLPLAHTLERCCELSVFMAGGAVDFYYIFFSLFFRCRWLLLLFLLFLLCAIDFYYFFSFLLCAIDFYYFSSSFLLCAIDFYYFFLLFLLGAVGFYSGNLKTLTADMKALKPTILPAVPRFQDPLSFHFCQCPHIFCHPCCEKSTQLSPGFSTGCMTAASTRQTRAVFSGKRKINKKDKSPNLEGTSSILPSRQRPESSTRDLSGGIQFGTNLSSGWYLFLQNISCWICKKVWMTLFLNQMARSVRNRLGGNVRLMIVGSATSPNQYS